MSRRHTPMSSRLAAAPAPAAAGHRPLLLAVALAAGFSALQARAQPSGAQAIVGTAALSQQGSRLVVTTQNGAGTSHSSINWQSFSVPAGTTTHFAQPGVSSTSINRVVGPDPSAIFGTLSSNGRLVLVNPAGITVGAGAVVDTAAFTASTLRMGDADALAGRLRFGDGSGATLRVDGQVLARQGDVVLIGQNVQTGSQALIQSPQGATLLAAGQKVEVTGRGLEGIVFELQAPADQALNLGTLRGDAVGVFAGTLKHSGVIQAQAVSTEGGKVVLRAADTAQAAGTIQAQGPGGAGGSVDVLGSKVGVLAGATIDTSNTAGGGRIRIGGDYQGGNADVPNAQVTYLDRDAQLRANATVQGDGGRVIVWADDTTRAYGRIEANAGAQGGNGGFVETSGKRYLDVNGIRVQASAVGGATGTWLLDPDDITIAASPGSSNIDETPANVFQPIDNGYQSMLYDATLNAALDGPSGVNVVVKTGAVNSSSFGSGSGDITVLGGVNLQRTAAGSATLTLDAHNDIRFSGGVTTFGATDPMPSPAPVARTLNVVLKAGANGMGSIVTEQGAGVQTDAIDGVSTVNLTADLSASANKRWTNNGNLMLGAAGLVDLGAIELENNGYVGGSSGTLKVATFTQPAPSPTSPPPTLAPFGSMSLEVTQAFNVTGGDVEFDGANLTITQQAGDLIFPSGMASVGATGAIQLTANAGSVSVQRDMQGGSIRLKATGDIDTWYLSTLGVYNGQPGTVSLDAGGSVQYSQISTSGNGTYGSAGGAVTIKGTLGVAGGVIATNGYDGGSGGVVSVTSQGDIDLWGGVDTTGGYNSSGAGGTGGAVTIASSGGNVSSAWIDTYGGSSGAGAGGNGGAVTVSGQAVQLSSISTTGGDSDNGVQGGNGGSVSVTAASGLSFFGGGDLLASEFPSYGLAWVETGGGRGGDRTEPGGVGGAGGNAGAVGFTVHSGLMDLGNVLIDAWGGDGGTGGSVGGAGGSGGAITLQALNGSIATSEWSWSTESSLSFISSRGGWGGDTIGLSSTDRGGRGGDAKAITIVAGSGSVLLGEIRAHGGGGGDASSAGARGGAGGNGAAITISGPGPVVLAGGISAAGGDGGLGADPSYDGSAGATGTFTTNVAGGITIPSAPALPTVGAAFDPDGMGSLNIDARWTNNGSVVMTPYSWVLTSQPVTNNGTLDLGHGSVLTLGSYDRETYTFVPGGASTSFTNAAGGVLQGQGTLEAGTVFNAGTLRVGDSASSPFSPIGTFSIAGDLVQQATGKLVFDIAANTPYQPGLTYDQLRVSGSAVLGGTLQVNPIAAVDVRSSGPSPTLPPDSQPLAWAMASGSGASDTYVLMDIGGSASGSFSSYAGPADLVALLQMRSDGVLGAIPGAVVPPAPTPPAPVVLAGDPLVDRVLGMLNGAASRDQVQAALGEQNTLVSKALQLLLDEQERQRQDGAAGDIVYTDAACKPS